MPDDRIYPSPDFIFPKNLFKSPRHAKKIIAKLSAVFFDSNDINAEKKLGAYLQGTLKPKFVSEEDFGYYPEFREGCSYIAVLVAPNDSVEQKYEKWKKALATIQPAVGEFFMRSIVGIYASYLSDEAKKELDLEVEKEIAEEDGK